MAEKRKKGFKLHALNPMVLLGIIMFLAFLASYIVPAGEYSRVMNPVLISCRDLQNLHSGGLHP